MDEKVRTINIVVNAKGAKAGADDVKKAVRGVGDESEKQGKRAAGAFDRMAKSLSARDITRAIDGIKRGFDLLVPIVGGVDEQTRKLVDSTLEMASAGAKMGAAFGPAGAAIGGVLGGALVNSKELQGFLSEMVGDLKPIGEALAHTVGDAIHGLIAGIHGLEAAWDSFKGKIGLGGEDPKWIRGLYRAKDITDAETLALGALQSIAGGVGAAVTGLAKDTADAVEPHKKHAEALKAEVDQLSAMDKLLASVTDKQREAESKRLDKGDDFVRGLVATAPDQAGIQKTDAELERELFPHPEKIGESIGDAVGVGVEKSGLGGTLEGVFTSATDSFADGLVSALNGEAVDWKSLFKDIAKQAEKAGLTSLLGLLFSGGGGGGNALPGLSGLMSGVVGAVGHHDGGIVGGPPTFTRAVHPGLFSGAPRYHSGGIAGLRPDEVPAILQRGERVLSRSQTAAAAAAGPGKVEFHFHGPTDEQGIRRAVPHIVDRLKRV